MLGNDEHIQLPFNLRIVDQSFKTFYYGQGDNNVKVDTIYLKKIILSSNTTQPPQILKIYETLSISSKIIGNRKTR